VVRRGIGGRACLTSGRLTRLEPALRQRHASEAPRLVRRILPVCGWAQGIACLRAVEDALSRPAIPAAEAARDRLLLGESAMVQIWRAAIDWPALQGLPPAPSLLRAGRTGLDRLVRALWPLGDPLDLEAPVEAGSGATAAGALADLLDDIAGDLPDRPEAIRDWAIRADHPFARLIRRGAKTLPAAAGAQDEPMPRIPEVVRRLAADPGFCRAPHRSGEPCDPGPLSALPARDRDAFAAFGPLAGRFAAMLFQMRRTAERLRAPGGDDARPYARLRISGWSAGCADTARGPLVQIMRLSEDRVTAFRSVAPTEWLLHPLGGLTRCLSALPPDAPEADLRLVLAAFDPCAPVTLAALRAEQLILATGETN
jgi:hypothetical protein